MLSLGGDSANSRDDAMKFDVNQIFSSSTMSMHVRKNRQENPVPAVSCGMPLGDTPAGTVDAEDAGARIRRVV
jgi:hypothetical protein